MNILKDSMWLDWFLSLSKYVETIYRVLEKNGLTTKEEIEKMVADLDNEKEFKEISDLVSAMKELEEPSGDKIISYLSSVFGNFEDDGK